MSISQAPVHCSLCAGPLHGGELACGDCGRPVARAGQPAARQLMGFLVSDEHPRADYWAIRLGPNDIGRSPQLSGDICLQQETISLCHATLFADGQGYAVTDHGSTNGTYVNGELLPPGITVSLRDGDALCFGSFRMCLVDVWLRMR